MGGFVEADAVVHVGVLESLLECAEKPMAAQQC